MTEIMALPQLTSLALYYNSFNGTIPVEYGRLQSLELHYNKLDGSLPDGFFQMATSLSVLNVGANQLTGTISSSIGLATALGSLSLFENNFQGTLPAAIYDLPLVDFQAQSNLIAGNLPLDTKTNSRWISTLESLWLQNNALTGTIPTIFGQYFPLLDLRLGGNKISGAIPDSLYNLATLTRLYLNDNQLTGPLSDRVALMSSLATLDVSNNKLTGSIPTSLSV